MKYITIVLLIIISCPLFSNDNAVALEIPDPSGIVNTFDKMRFLDERNFSVEQGSEYHSFLNNVFSKLKTSKIEDMYEFIGDWDLVDSVQSKDFDYFRNRLQTVEIGWGEGDTTAMLVYGPVGPWGIYDYGEYYLSTFSTMGGIAPLLLLNFVNNHLYFYTLEGSTWKLLPFHKGGEVYLKKVLPNS